VHQDGLVHISEISDTFVKDPNDVVKPQQKVNAYVLEVDAARKRISLSLKSNPQKRIRSAGDAAKQGTNPRQPQPPRKFGGRNEPFGNSFGDAFSKFGR